jgi:hypothetical protein
MRVQVEWLESHTGSVTSCRLNFLAIALLTLLTLLALFALFASRGCARLNRQQR